MKTYAVYTEVLEQGPTSEDEEPLYFGPDWSIHMDARRVPDPRPNATGQASAWLVSLEPFEHLSEQQIMAKCDVLEAHLSRDEAVLFWQEAVDA